MVRIRQTYKPSSKNINSVRRIGEKLVDWVDQSDPLALDTILKLTSLYWFTDTIARSLYPYSQITTDGKIPSVPFSKTKPLGYSRYPYELSFLPAAAGELLHPNIIRYDHEKVWMP